MIKPNIVLLVLFVGFTLISIDSLKKSLKNHVHVSEDLYLYPKTKTDIKLIEDSPLILDNNGVVIRKKYK